MLPHEDAASCEYTEKDSRRSEGDNTTH